MRLSDLQHKDVVNMKDGKLVGNIIDVSINALNGSMEKLIVEKSKFFVSLFSNKNEIEIRWEQIEKIGEDVILVRIDLWYNEIGDVVWKIKIEIIAWQKEF